MVERIHHQLLPGKSLANRFVAMINSGPVLAALSLVEASADERFLSWRDRVKPKSFEIIFGQDAH